MSDLHPKARALIAAARRREEPLPETTRSRVRQSVLRRAAAFGAATATTTSASVAAKAGAGAALAKSVLSVGLVAALGGAGFGVVRTLWKAPRDAVSRQAAVVVAASPGSAGAVRAAPSADGFATGSQALPALDRTVPGNTEMDLPSGKISGPSLGARDPIGPQSGSPARGGNDRPLPSAQRPAAPGGDRERAGLGGAPVDPVDSRSDARQRRISPLAADEAAAIAPAPMAASSSSDAAPSSLAIQLDVLHRVRAALGSRRPDQALSLLDHYASILENGPLAEEAAAARISALCQTGRGSEARAALDRLVASWPRSPLAAELARECQGAGRSPGH